MSTAQELFEELGYEKAEKSNSVVLYTNGYGDTISFKETKHVVIIPIQGCRSFTMTCLLENAIHKQCKELGWIGEEKQKTKEETNLEHFYNDLLKIGSGSFGVTDGKVKQCYNMSCSQCDINRIDNRGYCRINAIKWLASPYKKPAYKLTRFEYDLLSSYANGYKFKDIIPLIVMKEKEYFKNVDKDAKITDILENCEIKGEENYD